MNIPEKIIFKARKLFSGDAVLGEKFYHFDADVLNARGEIYIAGLWQSYRYFESIEQKIRTAFQFRLPLSAKASELHKRIKATNAVCVNVRRTDYVNIASTANTMGTIPVDYYKKALDIIAAKYDKPEIFIFSDDIAWCKEHLNIFKYPHFFVDHTYAGEQFSDYMQLMTACNHFIIPNSSFAWWAAWLNTSGDKIVIAPKKWMADTSVNTTDLIPNTWIRI
ncbi:alpha-1,2-fucosyltransferase [Sediminibacterium ginsengisoli]|nr:alpha-1,2-fucosyltransferase [Sediminibacterium ginsengisoli]